MTDLFGSQLDDTLYGNLDNHSILALAGNDRIFGSSGFENFNSDSGNNTIFSDQNDELINGTWNNDILVGDLGSDTLQGFYGNDALFGGQGNDLLKGEEDNDQIYGDLGNDTLIGIYTGIFSYQPGVGELDTLTGGEGADFFVLGDSYQSYYVGTGNSDFAVIPDFQSELDTIAVTDTHQVAVELFSTGVGIYDISSGIYDLIAFLPGLTQSPDLYSYQTGYGLVDASAAVARSVYQQNPFPEVLDSIANPWGIDRVKAPEVWTQGYTGQGVVVAVIDTGVDYNHPDLASNIWNNPGEIANNNIDDDGNGYIDDIRGWDFIENDNDPIESYQFSDFSNPVNYYGHGTHVAGTIAAANNGFGVTGVAPNAKIMPIRVFENDAYSSSIILEQGIRYATNNGADVINLSWTWTPTPGIETAIQDAINQGVVVVMASGNEYFSTPSYPAQLATDGGIAVGALDIAGNVPYFSNGAGMLLDYVVAPGVDVYSTTPNNRYEFYEGTSMATPHVAGVAALMLSANPALTPAQVEEIIVQTANPHGIVA
jgi:subtilisin family serine protease